MAGRRPRSIVSYKIKLTILVAGIGSLATILGGLSRIEALFIAGLAIVAASPYISLALTLRLIRREDYG